MEKRTLKSRDVISVVISAYNSSRTIGDTLSSLENQTLSKDLYEVVVMDDGSRDFTGEIVKEFVARGKAKFFYFYKENEGVGRARNDGIAKTVGKILAFTDADCICDPDWLEVIHRKIVTEGESFIGGRTYTEDTVIFPWKMAPVGQEGITANMAVDFTRIEGALFDSGFTGMLGDDTDFTLRMESKGMKQAYVPEMGVHHPPNVIGLRRIVIRARGRHNEVSLYKKHGKKVFSSFSWIFRPVVFSRISPFAILVLSSVAAAYAVFSFFGWTGLAAAFAAFVLFFLLSGYRFCVVHNPDGRNIPLSDRFRTLSGLIVITPLFFYYRAV